MAPIKQRTLPPLGLAVDWDDALPLNRARVQIAGDDRRSFRVGGSANPIRYTLGAHTYFDRPFFKLVYMRRVNHCRHTAEVIRRKMRTRGYGKVLPHTTTWFRMRLNRVILHIESIIDRMQDP